MKKRVAPNKNSGAVRHLKKSDPILRAIIEAVGPCPLAPNLKGTHFDHIVRAIIYQQLSGKAAGTIHSRVKSLFDGADPTPEELLATPDDQLRAKGLSHRKISYLKDLAQKTRSGELAIDALHGLGDDLIIEQLTQIKGIGRWTAQMFLMFRLYRPNVLPVVDLGIRKAVQKAYRLKKDPDEKKLRKIAKVWEPHCTVACWYLWRSLELE